MDDDTTRDVGIELPRFTRVLDKVVTSGRFQLLAVTGFLLGGASLPVAILWMRISMVTCLTFFGMWLMISAYMLLLRRLKPEYVRSLPWAYRVSTAAGIGCAAVMLISGGDSAAGLLAGLLIMVFMGCPLVPSVEAYIKLERLDGGIFAASGGTADFELDEVLRVSSRSDSDSAPIFREVPYSGLIGLLPMTGFLFAVSSVPVIMLWMWISMAVYLLFFGIWLMISAYMLLLRRLKPEYVRSWPWAYGVSTVAAIGCAAVVAQVLSSDLSHFNSTSTPGLLLYLILIGCPLVPFVEAYIKLGRPAFEDAADFELDEVLRVSSRSDSSE